MKFYIFIILVLCIQQSIQEYAQVEEEYNYTPHSYDDDDFESPFSSLHPISTEGKWKKTKKAKKCIAAGLADYKDLNKLVHHLKTFNIFGDVVDIFNLTKRIGTILMNCDVLFCWKPTIRKCKKDGHPHGCEKYGLLVYPKCEKGYTNWDCCVCATTCPENFTDNGLYCLKPRAYGRGVGYVLWKRDQCEKDYPKLGCEKNGALWYPKCEPGFHNVGCCICSPNCPEGWTDIGISCKKPHSYGRGVGYPVTAGPSCLLPWNLMALNEQQGECQERLGVMDLLNQSVEAKINIFEKTDEYPDGFVDELIELTKLTNLYADKCIAPYESVQDQIE